MRVTPSVGNTIVLGLSVLIIVIGLADAYRRAPVAVVRMDGGGGDSCSVNADCAGLSDYSACPGHATVGVCSGGACGTITTPCGSGPFSSAIATHCIVIDGQATSDCSSVGFTSSGNTSTSTSDAGGSDSSAEEESSSSDPGGFCCALGGCLYGSDCGPFGGIFEDPNQCFDFCSNTYSSLPDESSSSVVLSSVAFSSSISSSSSSIPWWCLVLPSLCQPHASSSSSSSSAPRVSSSSRRSSVRSSFSGRSSSASSLRTGGGGTGGASSAASRASSSSSAARSSSSRASSSSSSSSSSSRAPIVPVPSSSPSSSSSSSSSSSRAPSSSSASSSSDDVWVKCCSEVTGLVVGPPDRDSFHDDLAACGRAGGSIQRITKKIVEYLRDDYAQDKLLCGGPLSVLPASSGKGGDAASSSVVSSSEESSSVSSSSLPSTPGGPANGAGASSSSSGIPLFACDSRTGVIPEGNLCRRYTPIMSIANVTLFKEDPWTQNTCDQACAELKTSVFCCLASSCTKTLSANCDQGRGIQFPLDRGRALCEQVAAAGFCQ